MPYQPIQDEAEANITALRNELAEFKAEMKWQTPLGGEHWDFQHRPCGGDIPGTSSPPSKDPLLCKPWKLSRHGSVADHDCFHSAALDARLATIESHLASISTSLATMAQTFRERSETTRASQVVPDKDVATLALCSRPL
ncbi:hypothetical protein FQN54_006910 [Arachnomyces sp. PD_36]|nr:hypothetical protein FQN54_006910 [Arachnomyces sp. PD_36]